MSEKTFYEVLEVDSKALLTELKANFRRLAFFHHPDKVKHLGEAAQMRSDLTMREITEAFSVLKDQVKRRLYDECLKTGKDFAVEYSRAQSETDEDRQKRKDKAQRKKYMLVAAGRAVAENIKALDSSVKWSVEENGSYFDLIMNSMSGGNRCHVYIKTIDQLLPEELGNIIDFANNTEVESKSMLIRDHFSFVIIAARLKEGVEIRESIKKYNSALLNTGRGVPRRGLVLIKVKRPEPFVPYNTHLSPDFASLKLKLI